MKPLGLTVTETAKALGISRPVLSDIVNERAGISPDMALRLEKAFGSKATLWLRLQTAYDLARAQRRVKTMKVKKLYKGELVPA